MLKECAGLRVLTKGLGVNRRYDFQDCKTACDELKNGGIRGKGFLYICASFRKVATVAVFLHI